MSRPKPPQSVSLPVATVRPRRRFSIVWILPLAAIGFAAALMFRTWEMRGLEVVIAFEDGHGLRAGDEVRFRGIKVGDVESVTLAPDANGTVVVASLLTHARQIARQGTLFWIERPRIAPSGVRGLDTILGPRYLAVRLSTDGHAPTRTQFDGLSEAPIIEGTSGGDLEVILQADGRGSLQPGAAVNYREVRVGTILAVGLASDGSVVEARAHIQHAYAPLIRQRTRFWDSGGVTLDASFAGVHLEVDSLEALMVGSVSLATPPDSGEPVRNGHRFALAKDPAPEWLRWKPTVAVGSELLPAGASLPSPERARLTWRQGTVLRSTGSRSGWTIPLDDGLLGPIDLFLEDESAREGTSRLEVAGRALDHGMARLSSQNESLAILSGASLPNAWPRARMRQPAAIEECVIVASATMTPIPLSAARVSDRSGWWRIDEAISFDDSWHGACVLSRIDGALVGVLLVSDGVGRVVLIPRTWSE